MNLIGAWFFFDVRALQEARLSPRLSVVHFIEMTLLPNTARGQFRPS